MIGGERLRATLRPTLVLAAVIVGAGCASVLPPEAAPAPTVPPIVADLAAWPATQAWVTEHVTIEEHTDSTPMGVAWPAAALAWPGHIRLDAECGDGWCWQHNTPDGNRAWWAAHETGHTVEVADWFPANPSEFRRGERWAQCVAEAITSEANPVPPVDLYWDCPDDLTSDVAGELAALGVTS